MPAPLTFTKLLVKLEDTFGFRAVKSKIIGALKNGNYQHQARGGAIEVKNLLQSGEVTAMQVIGLLGNCTSHHHESSPHHQVAGVEVHIIKKDAWYIKFYFIDPDIFFISVHR